MKLDYVPATEAYTLRVPRSEGVDVKQLMLDHGLDLSTTASTPDTALLFTKEPYCAATFRDHATPAARTRLGAIIREIDTSWASTGTAHIACPADQELWPFQIADVEYALRRQNTLVADQPGLGKTPVAICYANEIKAKRVLVICPANIRLQWCKRIREWTTLRWPYIVYPILHGRHGVHPSAQWTVVSYDLARTEHIGKALARGLYDLVIFDEAHYLKTIDSARTHAAFGDLATGWMRKAVRNEAGDILDYDRWFPGLATRCGAILALTGTPLPNRPREAYTLARNLCLGAETPILTSNGVKRIIEVTQDDLLWDGVEWVSHDGLISQGYKSTSVFLSVEMTGDHKILSGPQWHPWSRVTQDGIILSRALETGMESIRSLATHLGRAVLASSSNVPVARRLIGLCSTILGTGALSGAGNATTNFFRLTRSSGTDMERLSLTAFSEGVCSTKSRPSLGAVTTQMTGATNTMVLEELAYGPLGEKIERGFSNTSQRSPGGAIPNSTSTGRTTTEDMNQATSDLSPEASTCKTDDLSSHYSNASQNLKPVYDIVNAGPRHRFTILTRGGPMVVSNCWDSIDWMSEDSFSERFNPSMTVETVNRLTGKTSFYIDERTGRHAELQNRLRANFMVRHLKRDVMPQLKLPILDIVLVEESGAVKQALKAESMLDIDPEQLQGADAEVLGHIAAVRRLMGIAKAPLVAEYAEMVLDGGEEKIVVFAHHIAVMDILQERLSKYGVLRIDGSVTPAHKQRLVDLYLSDRSKRVLLGNMQSVGVGTDGLQEVASHAIFGECSWVPGENIQCIDRLDRGGQTRTVQADFLVAPGSLDEKILSSALKKNQTIHRALDKHQ